MTESAEYVVTCPRCETVYRTTWGVVGGPHHRMDCWSCGRKLEDVAPALIDGTQS